jgi:hypothetical protein
MKKVATLIALSSMFALVGCAVGPCDGYGCPGFTHSGQALQAAPNSAPSSAAAGQKTQAHNQGAVAPTAKSGQ